ncbi:MAG: hypothetical protein WCY33_06405 [Clostridia bacterium]
MTSRSTFPTTLDVFTENYDLPASLLTDAIEWQTLAQLSSRTPTQEARFGVLTIELAPYLFTAEKLNYLQDAMANIESFTKTTIEDYYKYQGVYDPATTYSIFNTCYYNGEIYMALQNTTNHLPTDPTYFLKIGSKGDQGIQGNPGSNLVNMGEYDNAVSYSVNQLVTYNNIAYYCISPTVGNLPSNTTYWNVFLMPTSSVDYGLITGAVGNNYDYGSLT